MKTTTTESEKKHDMIIIRGQIISKKNSKEIRYNRKTKKPFIGGSRAYLDARDDIIWQCKACHTRFAGPVHVSYKFYLKGNQDIDVDNAQASCNDALQAAGIIDNDKNIMSFDGEKIKGSKEHITIITIREL